VGTDLTHVLDELEFWNVTLQSAGDRAGILEEPVTTVFTAGGNRLLEKTAELTHHRGCSAVTSPPVQCSRTIQT